MKYKNDFKLNNLGGTFDFKGHINIMNIMIFIQILNYYYTTNFFGIKDIYSSWIGLDSNHWIDMQIFC